MCIHVPPCAKGHKCAICQAVGSESHPDLHILNALEVQKDQLDTVRQLREDLSNQPIYAKTAVLFVKHAEKLSVASQNALLIFLEEPPTNALVILATQVRKYLLPTVLSRCAYFKLPPGSSDAPDERYRLMANEYFNVIQNQLLTGSREELALAKLVAKWNSKKRDLFSGSKKNSFSSFLEVFLGETRERMQGNVSGEEFVRLNRIAQTVCELLEVQDRNVNSTACLGILVQASKVLNI
jgi:hypothetical protein